MKKGFLLALCLVGTLCCAPAFADDDNDPMVRAGVAVANILFEYDGDQFTTYTVRPDGFLDIDFALNTPENLYNEILHKLQGSPDIKGVLAGKGGPNCFLFGAGG